MPKFERWTGVTRDCYERKGNCVDCAYMQMTSGACVAKKAVEQLLKSFGEPPIESEDEDV